MKIPFLHKGKREITRRPSPGRPRYPVWKDEKLFGLFSLRMTLLVAGLGLIGFIVVMVIGAFTIIDLNDKVGRQANDNTTALRQIQKLQKDRDNLQKERHDERLADQQRTDIKIHNLACGTLTLFRAGDPRGKKLRDSFLKDNIHCPPLGQPFVPIPVPSDTVPDFPSAPTTGAGSGGKSPSNAPAPTGAGSSPSPSGKGTVKSTPGPTQTKTIVKTASPSPKPRLPIIPCATVLIITVNCP